jgi:egghead protein (zeste-white 4 protein)
MTIAATSPTRAPFPRELRPGFASFVVPYVVVITVVTLSSERDRDVVFIDWYVTVVWSFPVLTSVLGLAGGLLTVRRATRTPSLIAPSQPAPELLIVVIPTIGRHDVVSALERVVASCCRHLPAQFARWRIDLVIEEDCEARSHITWLAARHTAVRIVEIPRDYRTPRGTRFKARANHYANLLRLADGEARDDVWVLHMDDDTGVGTDTVADLHRFVLTQRAAGDEGLHLAQGVLTYAREQACNRWVWLADAVRPGCDISLFAAATGRGTPHGGLHGELLLVRASVEAAIGWDFGPSAIVEDAQFALVFCGRYPGRSDWFAGRSYGASPATVADFLRQRERWVAGLLQLATNRAVPLRHRRLLIHNLMVWVCSPAQHPFVVLLLGALLGNLGTTPVTATVIPLWALNAAFCVWLYWEGYRINVASSTKPRPDRWEPVWLVVLIPLFVLWEAIGIARDVVRFLRRGETSFTVIPKPL